MKVLLCCQCLYVVGGSTDKMPDNGWDLKLDKTMFVLDFWLPIFRNDDIAILNGQLLRLQLRYLCVILTVQLGLGWMNAGSFKS